MYEDMAVKMAQLVTSYSQPVKEGDFVVIQGGMTAQPLMEALYEAVLRRGGNPVVNTGINGLGELKLMLGSDDQLRFQDPSFKLYMETADVLFNIFSSDNTKSLASTDPKRLAILQESQREAVEIFFSRMGDRSLRLNIMPWPSVGEAQEAEMGIQAYRKFVYEACAFHLDDPLAYWHSMRDRQMRLVDYLSDKSHAHIKGRDIDIQLEFGGRKWVSAHGEINFPDGEIFTGPIEESVNGWVHFNLRTLYAGREVRGVKFEYKDGKIINASAAKNEEFLFSQLDMDEGARRMGEFAIGTNWNIQQVTGSTLFDEKIGGSIHMAIGRSIPETLGQNMSTVHWDMVHDMKDGGEIYIDGKLFYQNGQFVEL